MEFLLALGGNVELGRKRPFPFVDDSDIATFHIVPVTG